MRRAALAYDRMGLTLVTEVAGPLLIEVRGEMLHKGDLMHQVLKQSEEITIPGSAHRVGIWGGIETDVSHDDDHHVLLHVELSGVKTPGVSEGSKLTSRKDVLQEFACREAAIHNQPSTAARGGLERVGTHSNWATGGLTLIPGYRMLKN